MRASRLARRGALALTVQDPVSNGTYQIYEVEPTLISSIVGLFLWGGAISADWTLYLLSPGGRISRLAAFGSAYHKDLWIRRAEEVIAESGVEGLRSCARSITGPDDREPPVEG